MNVLLTAARRPLPIIVLIVAIFTGLTVALWMLPLGVLVYFVAVILASLDPTVQITAQRSVSHGKITSKTFQAIINEIDRSQREVERSIAQAQGPLAQVLQPIEKQTEDLVQQAHMLANKGQIIEHYLAQINYHQLQDQINQLDTNIATTKDSYTLQQLQETRQAIVKRQKNARDLETFIGRIMAQLQNIDANLDNVVAETVRLRTADVVQAGSGSNQVAEQLKNLNSDMSAFRQVLDTALMDSGAEE